MEQHVTPIRRTIRIGQPDGASEQATYVARWVDEDTGPHDAVLKAQSEQSVRDTLEPLVGSNSLQIRKLRA